MSYTAQLHADPTPGLCQGLVVGCRSAREPLGRAPNQGGELVGVALQEGTAAPVLEATQQIGEIELVPRYDEGVGVGGVEGDLVLSEQTSADSRR